VQQSAWIHVIEAQGVSGCLAKKLVGQLYWLLPQVGLAEENPKEK